MLSRTKTGTALSKSALIELVLFKEFLYKYGIQEYKKSLSFPVLCAVCAIPSHCHLPPIADAAILLLDNL